ncbi:MAG TPA: type 4a pilus biogenesis protein PilO [Rhodocyclaceae bacterium]|nr:type 4a pilus biogenesis protein PilO [Rhodocyclaceae bacterium]
MSVGKTPFTRRKIDFEALAGDFKGLDQNDPGQWPLAPRVAVFISLFVATIAAAWWFDWRDQADLLARREAEEQQLRLDWAAKKRLAVNLHEYRRQLEETDRQFGALLKQLPNRAEMDSLLADINQAGLGRGLSFELFKPGADVVKDFYAEMPIAVSIVGEYDDFGAFASDVAQMPRIVTLNDVSLTRLDGGPLKMEAKAVTYRYLDEEELALQRQKQEQEKKDRQGRK